MAINVNIYSNANNSTRTIVFDFVGEIMVPSDLLGSPDHCNQYYFKISTSAKQDDNSSYPLKIVRSLDSTPANVASLALNGQVQSMNPAAYTNAYPDIRSMIIDYVYDYVNGHTANQYSSGCTEQKPMKFN